MKFRENMNEIMEHIQVEDELRDAILNQTTRRDKRIGFLGMKSKTAVATAVSVLLIGSVAVAATTLPKLWNSTIAKMFGADAKTQEKLVDEGYADVIETNSELRSTDILTAENNGITVSVKQTLSDKYGLRIYLDVKSQNGLKLIGNRLFDGNGLYIDGKDIYDNRGAGFVVEENKKSDYEAIYQIYGTSDNGVDIVGKEIRIHLVNLIGGEHKLDNDVLVKGDWILQWKVKSNSASKTIQLNNDFNGKGIVKGKILNAVYHLKSLEISPFSFCLKYECENYNRISAELNEDCVPVNIIMKDGTKYSNLSKDDRRQISGPGMQDDKHEVVVFSEIVIDVDNIDYVEVGGVKYDIENDERNQ